MSDRATATLAYQHKLQILSDSRTTQQQSFETRSVIRVCERSVQLQRAAPVHFPAGLVFSGGRHVNSSRVLESPAGARHERFSLQFALCIIANSSGSSVKRKWALFLELQLVLYISNFRARLREWLAACEFGRLIGTELATD